MAFVTSRDGTRIAYEKHGAGPALVLCDGALCYRGGGWTVQMAELLKDQFTVYAYDRRGRGESGNTLPYAPEREVEDLEAIIALAGGPVYLYGHSSGGVLVLDAANRSKAVTKLVVYEAPLMTDGERQLEPSYLARMQELIAAGRNGDAVKHFMGKGVGMPGFIIFLIQFAPFFTKLKAIAPTLAHDTAITEPMQHGLPVPKARWANVTAPATIVGGGKSPAWLRNAQRNIAAALRHGTHLELPGQTHAVKLQPVAELLRRTFTA